MTTKDHWERVYATRSAEEVSWYQEHPGRSLHFIRTTGVALSAPIIDIGGGASRLVDDLLRAGYTALTVLDVSAAALAAARQRLGTRANEVQWLQADVTRSPLSLNTCDVWHDRAVFHFLTSAADRRAYIEALLRAVRPGGHVIVATFAVDGPTACSGLPVMRYSADALHREFGGDFTPVREEEEGHRTPRGEVQHFVYCHWRLAVS